MGNNVIRGLAFALGFPNAWVAVVGRIRFLLGYRAVWNPYLLQQGRTFKLNVACFAIATPNGRSLDE